jgi:hypothetical protein
MSVTESGIVIEVKPELFANVYALILVTPDGIIASPTHSAPAVTTLSSIVKKPVVQLTLDVVA